MWRMCNNAGDFNFYNDVYDTDNLYTALVNTNADGNDADTDGAAFRDRSDNVYNLYAADDLYAGNTVGNNADAYTFDNVHNLYATDDLYAGNTDNNNADTCDGTVFNDNNVDNNADDLYTGTGNSVRE